MAKLPVTFKRLGLELTEQEPVKATEVQLRLPMAKLDARDTIA